MMSFNEPGTHGVSSVLLDAFCGKPPDPQLHRPLQISDQVALRLRKQVCSCTLRACQKGAGGGGGGMAPRRGTPSSSPPMSPSPHASQTSPSPTFVRI